MVNVLVRCPVTRSSAVGFLESSILPGFSGRKEQVM